MICTECGLKLDPETIQNCEICTPKECNKIENNNED